jgi:hypothetical protein
MKLVLATALLAALTSVPVLADCTYPTNRPTKFPDGKTAPKEEMLAAMKGVKAYTAEMEAYMACIQLERDDTIAKQGETLTPEKKKQLDDMYARKHDAAFEELTAVTTPFNEQVREYTKAHPSKPK